MNYLKYALKKQEENPDIEIFGGVNIEIIVSAETKMGVSFPSQYKSFLSECGSCSIYDTYISGLFPEWDNMTSTGSRLHDTLEARKVYNLPLNYIVLEYVDNENYYVLNIPDDPKENGNVFSVDINSEGKLTEYVEIYKSFDEYFKSTLDN